MSLDTATRPEYACATSTHFGKVREHNEDFFVVRSPGQGQPYGLYILCDGMGGTARGDVASETAANAIQDYVVEHYRDGAAPEKVLEEALKVAQQSLKAHQQEHYDTIGMGCTAVVGLIDGSDIVVAHVGDSRCYLASESSLEAITQDHSWAAELFRAGALKTEEEVRTHHQRHILTRFLGGREPQDIEVDLVRRKVEVGTRVLFCTDGLWDMVRDERILQIVRSAEPQSAADLLVQEANHEGGKDNVTVIVLERTG